MLPPGRFWDGPFQEKDQRALPRVYHTIFVFLSMYMLQRIGRHFDERINCTPWRSIKGPISKCRRDELTSDHSDLEKEKEKEKENSPFANWLLTFNNVICPKDLEDYWPEGHHGTVLITSRDPDFIPAPDTVPNMRPVNAGNRIDAAKSTNKIHRVYPSPLGSS
ncbi:unnamed protein product [Fusarium graminearum]|uniref:Uncharacterized protein n=1 Tax=Gibberella zeae TaxID=5518 RepID=A0A9N8NBZ3_GIBZA|nr:unnamed protein product [Fusarium graminearum]